MFGSFERFADALRKASGVGGYLTGAKTKAYQEAGEPSEGSTIDIVLFKECFMGMLETAFELEGAADYMIASQGRVPRLSWPYVDIFRRLAISPGKLKTAEEIKKYVNGVAVGIRQDLQSFYEVARNRRGKDEVPFSLVDVPALCQSITAPMKELVKALESTTGSEDEQRIRKQEVEETFDRCSIGDSALVDLGSVCERLSRLRGQSAGAIPENALALSKLHDPSNSLVTGSSPSAFRGLSVFYFPRPLEALGPPSAGGSFVAPVVARHPERYLAFRLNEKTGWNGVALRQAGGWNLDLCTSLKSGRGNSRPVEIPQTGRTGQGDAFGDVFGMEPELSEASTSRRVSTSPRA